MSTRADFYLGRGPESIWLGSIGHDAYVENLAPYFEGATTEAAYRAGLQRVFAAYGEIPASRGWPWPWKDSHTTATAVTFDEGRVWSSEHSRNWAPIESSDKPGPVAAVFPDMVTAEEASAEGRLRRRLRLSGALSIAADQAVLPALLARVAYLLDRDWLHAHRQGDNWCMLYPDSAVQDAIFDFRRGVADHLETLKLLVDKQKKADGLEVWDLVLWCAEHFRSKHGVPEVDLEVTAETPVYFGEPLSDEIRAELRSGRLRYVVEPFTEQHVRGRHLLDAALDAIPFVHGYALGHSLVGTGFARYGRDVETALDVPRPELDGQPLRDYGASIERRSKMNVLAAQWRFDF
jgi:hypothetical protein